MSRVTSFLLTLMLSVAPAHAWNRTGHFISAAVAYDELKRNDSVALEQALAVLQAHSAAADWASWNLEFPDLKPGKVAFMIAAMWPDEARRGQFKAYDRPDWHYDSFPVRPGQPRIDTQKTPPMTGKAIEALHTQLTLFKDERQSVGERAEALSWVLHLVGDLAQPLHVGTLVDADFPNGDRGGNDVYVRGSERAQNPVRLHQIWDDGVGGNSVDLRAAAARAAQWAELPVPAIKDIDALVTLSYRLADGAGYLGGMLAYARADHAEAPVLPEGYTRALQSVAHQQVVVAGRLMATLLSQAP